MRTDKIIDDVKMSFDIKKKTIEASPTPPTRYSTIALSLGQISHITFFLTIYFLPKQRFYYAFLSRYSPSSRPRCSIAFLDF